MEKVAADRCFDCGEVMSDPWFSVQNGCGICIKCAGVHRGLGVEVSFVRSIKLDAIEPKHMEYLAVGGNERFGIFLEQYGMPRSKWLDLSIPERYASPPADLWRRTLEARIHGDPEPTDLRVTAPPPKPVSQPRRAAWTPNTKVCQVCAKPFSIVRRRHHCRRCGKCVCAGCSPRESRRPLPPIVKPCRHCVICAPPPAMLRLRQQQHLSSPSSPSSSSSSSSAPDAASSSTRSHRHLRRT